MIGIKNIGVYIPENRVSNLEKAKKLNLSTSFIKDKIGIIYVAKKNKAQTASDMCIEAFNRLRRSEREPLLKNTDLVCVCTQNGDFQIPQTSAIVQAKLGLPLACASFDISLGCSGYIYALHIVKSFMDTNDLKTGLLFTSDPYSDIIDSNDRNTDLIFGDGATVTVLSEHPVYSVHKMVSTTDGNKYDQIIKRKKECFYMNGRGVFDFVLKHVPESIMQCLEKNELKKEKIDLFLFHQANQYLVKNLIKRTGLDSEKVPIKLRDFGNTVSSSIPIILKDFLNDEKKETILLSGFGIGLSVASTIIRRIG
jgi:3-oxoacyl-[acyl-carrier-protein] synthase-3